MRVGVIQLCSGTDIACNLKEVEYFIRAAANDGAELIVTPEMTHIVQRNPQKLLKSIYKESEDPGVNIFSALAKELSVNILIGSLAIKSNPNKAVNRSFLFGAKGAIKARYDKIHLFDV
ncbi:MAG: carbon-nitrogen hydrolase family protein, partial [Hellea sp.]|nr:carbon-nitrogen hydrolase family protein [Hellea sp.]